MIPLLSGSRFVLSLALLAVFVSTYAIGQTTPPNREQDTHLTMTDTKIRFITPEVAVVDAHWEMTGVKDRDSRDIPLRKGLLNFVMTQSKGQWLITFMHNMDLPQQEPII